MSVIPLPDQGQPIDVTYLHDIVSTVNNLSSQFVNPSYNRTTIQTRNQGTYNKKNNEVKMVAGYYDVLSTPRAYDSGQSVNFTYSFDSAFAYPPIVTATIYASAEASNMANNATLVINSVDTGGFTGTVQFNKQGSYTISVNIIAIGVSA